MKPLKTLVNALKRLKMLKYVQKSHKNLKMSEKRQ
jgi:hypothetical protein